jgi:hypothetical protein
MKTGEFGVRKKKYLPPEVIKITVDIREMLKNSTTAELAE